MTEKPQFNLPQISRDHVTAHENVYFRLRYALMVGAIAPGTAMGIRNLAHYLKISPTPVREALRRLSSENALEVLDNRRIIVPQMSAGRFDELILLRVRLECLAAERALPYVSQVLIDRMTSIDVDMDQAIHDRQYDVLTELNQKFHETLYTANPHQAITPLIESVWLQIGPFQRQFMDRVMAYFVVDHHKSIVDALQNRDQKSLRAAITADIVEGIGRAGSEVLQASLEKSA